jgi:hypothetical protein
MGKVEINIIIIMDCFCCRSEQLEVLQEEIRNGLICLLKVRMTRASVTLTKADCLSLFALQSLSKQAAGSP